MESQKSAFQDFVFPDLEFFVGSVPEKRLSGRHEVNRGFCSTALIVFIVS